MKRILTILLCLCLVVALAIPALAADLNPEDYIVGIEGDTVSYDIPADEFYDYTLELTNSTATQSFRKVWSEPLTYKFSSQQSVWVIVSPFAEGDFLSVVDFPTTSRVRFNIRFSAQGSFNTSAARVRYQIRWFDADYDMIKYEVTDFASPDLNLFGQYVTLSKPDDAVYLTMIAQVNDVYVNPDVIFDFEFLGFQFEMSKSELEAAQVGKTNKLLEAINESINRPPDPKPPNYNDSANDMHDMESGLVGSLNDGTLENFGGNIADATDYLVSIGTGFAFIRDMIEPFINIPWMNVILICSLALGLLGAFLGLISDASAYDARREKERANREWRLQTLQYRREILSRRKKNG